MAVFQTMSNIVPLKEKEKTVKATNWLTAKEVSEITGLSVSSVSRYTNREQDPISRRRFGRKVQYNSEMLNQWIERNSSTNY